MVVTSSGAEPSPGHDRATPAVAPHDPSVDESDHLLATKQVQLIDAQVRQLGRQRWRDVIVTTLGAILLVGTAVFVWTAASSRAVVIEPFDTAPALAQRGLTPQVVAGLIQDAVVAIQDTTAEETSKLNISNAWTDQITVQVPNTGVSIADVDRMLRARLAHETHIRGAAVINPDGSVSLTVRANGVPASTFTGSPDQLPALATKGAEYIFGRFEPWRFVRYLIKRGRTDETIAFLEEAYPRAPEEQRSRLASAWATALGRRGLMREAVAKQRLAIELDPFNWNAAGNLIGTLWDVEGEEGAVRAGRELEQRLREAPASKQPPAVSTPLQNYQSLVGDWTGLIAATLASTKANGGRTNSAYQDSVASIGEMEAQRHDWRSARRYLAAGAPGPLTSGIRDMVIGYQALERRNASDAVRAFEGAKRIFDTNEDFRFSYPFAPCWLGRAYGLAGRFEEARRLIAASGRWSDCYNFAALVEEAAGNRAGADAADRRAKQLAPSLPSPYLYRGQTLLRRGDLAGAAAEFAAAHARGPHWADPLKGWGDVLARQARWAEAKAKYDAALPFAPNWTELRQARETARVKAAEQSWWPFD